MDRYVRETELLDFDAPALTRLVEDRAWKALPEYERIGAIYGFVKDEIRFGYNETDDMPASRVYADGYGQCNTKGILLMALLRAAGIPCRFHGFTIDKTLQKGAVTGWAYWLAPRSIIHSWVEVLVGGTWVNLEGFILDKAYLASLQRKFPEARQFCGYGAATADLQNPQIEWKGKDTYIQKDGINHDYGVFDSPDEFYARYGTNLSGFKRFLYRHIVRHKMNENVQRLRTRSSAG